MPRLTLPSWLLLLIACCPLPAAPLIYHISDAASGNNFLAANEWITITGDQLADAERVWQSSDFVNGQFPTQLGGVQVTIGGRPVPISYVGPGQVNALIPADMPSGPQEVRLTNHGVAADGYGSITIYPYAPSMFVWNVGGVPYAAVTHLDYSPAVPAGTFANLSTTAAQPGETVIFWMTGLGAANPAVPPNQVAPQASLVTTPLTFLMSEPSGSLHSLAALSAVVSPGFGGLYQVALQLPSTLPNGTYSVAVTESGRLSFNAKFVIGAPSSSGGGGKK